MIPRASGALHSVLHREIAHCGPTMLILGILLLMFTGSTILETLVCLFDDQMLDHFNHDLAADLLVQSNACTHSLLSQAPITHADGLLHVTVPIVALIVCVGMVATAWDATFFRLAIADINAVQSQSQSLLRWLSHECRSPVAAAMLSLDTAVSDILPNVKALLLGFLGGSSEGQKQERRLPAQLDVEWEELRASLKMVEQPMQSLSNVLDNMLLYMRRERSFLSSRQSVEAQIWGNHAISLTSVWAAAWQNASALEGVSQSQGNQGRLQGSSGTGVQVQHWLARADDHAAATTGTIDDTFHAIDAAEEMRRVQCSSSVTFSTAVQVLTNYLSNAVKYGTLGGAGLRCVVRFTLYDAAWLKAARAKHKHAADKPAMRATQITPLQPQVAQSNALNHIDASATMDSCSTPGKQYLHFSDEIRAAWRVARTLQQQSTIKTGDHAQAEQKHIPGSGRAVGDKTCGVLVLSVIDQGVGLSPADAATLFQPFTRLRSGGNVRGNGLGLWLMKGLVDSQGGAVGVHSAGLGGGCCFCAALPVLLRPTSGAAAPGVLADASSQGDGPMPFHRAASLDTASVLISGGAITRAASHASSSAGGSKGTAANDCKLLPSLDSKTSHHVTVPVPAGDAKDSQPSVPPHLPEALMPAAISSAGDSVVLGETRSFSTTSAPSARHSGASALPHLRVLVVDDSPTNRIMMARGIARRGHDVQQANDGMEALEVYTAALGRSQAFDLIVTDMTMPRMCGDELATALHAAWAEHCLEQGQAGDPSDSGPIVIGVTGNAMEGDVDAFLVAGAHAVLLKPTTITKVLQEAAAAMSLRE